MAQQNQSNSNQKGNSQTDKKFGGSDMNANNPVKQNSSRDQKSRENQSQQYRDTKEVTDETGPKKSKAV